LVDNILNKKLAAEPTQELEDRIELLIYKLYGLRLEEVKIVDPDIEKIISEKDYIATFEEKSSM